MEKREVPLASPSIGPDEIETLVEVLNSRWLAHGEYNQKFEQAFAEYIGVEYAISLNSCTSALFLALEVAGIKGEVIIPSFTWVATANVVALTGGTPVFCEVDPETRNVTAETIAEKITPRTEAVIVVHYGGQPCDMTAITELCDKHGLFLIEDSAETIGGTWNGQQAGSFSVGCFSFFPTKNITTGEGGMLTTNDPEFARRARALVTHGITSTTLEREKAQKPWLRAAEFPGYNFRLPNPLAALGYVQLQRLDQFNDRRIQLANQYDDLLKPLDPIVKTPVVREGATHVYQMYTILMPPELRDAALLNLRANGVGASAHFDPPVHLQPYYRDLGWKEGDLPITERLAHSLITLPIYPDMTDEDQEWIIHCIKQAVVEVQAK